jgi:pilus assembly protein CpaE
MMPIDPDDSDELKTAEKTDVAPLPRISMQAFCLSEALMQTLEAVATDRRMARVKIRIQTGGVAAAIEAFRDAPTPNLIIVEFRIDEVEELPFALDQLAHNCDAETRVVLVGPVNDVQLYREAVRRGVSDYLVLPLAPLQVIAALAELYHAKAGHPLGRCVAFVPAKGGSGSSTIAHNVSWVAGASLSIPVILVDTDVAFGTAALNFNQDPYNGLADVLFAQERPDTNMIDRTLCKVSDMLSLLAAANNLERSLDIAPTAIDDAMDALRAMAPLIVMDLPHQWSSWVQRVISGCDDLVIVAEPDLASLRNTKLLLEQAGRIRSHDRKPAILLNKIGMPKRPEIPEAEFLKAFSGSTHFSINFDAQLFGTAANNGQMLREVGAPSALDKTLLDLAGFLAGRTHAATDKSRNALSSILTRFVTFRR